MKRIKIQSIPPSEQDKAVLDSTMTLLERYAMSGTDITVLYWLEQKLKQILGSCGNSIKRIRDENQPPPTGRVFKVKR